MHTVCVCEQHQNAKLLVAALPEQLDYKNLLSELVFNLNEKNCMLHSCSQCLGRPQLQKALKKILDDNHRHHRLKGISTPGQTQAGLGPRVYSFTTPDCALPESDASSGVIKPASSFVIQNCQTLCSTCSMLMIMILM